LKIIQKLEPLYFTFVEEAHRVLKKGGRLVLVTPYIITRSGQIVAMPIATKFESSGFRKVQTFFPEMFSPGTVGKEELISASSIVEVDDRHKISREIHIYEKITD
jgi:tRNA G10  N-methylase Trm11